MAKYSTKWEPNWALERALDEKIQASVFASRNDVALAADITPSQLTRFVSGERRPYVDDLVRIARTLRVPVVELLRPYFNETDGLEIAGTDTADIDLERLRTAFVGALVAQSAPKSPREAEQTVADLFAIARTRPAPPPRLPKKGRKQAPPATPPSSPR